MGALQGQNHSDLVYGVFVAVTLWLRRGDPVQASEWAGLLWHAPGVDYGERQALQALCAELIDTLGMEAFAAAVECGKRLRIETVAERIVQGLAGADPRDSRTDKDPV